MANKVLDEFGQMLMSRVRDEAISQWDMILDGRMKGVTADRLRQALAGITGPDRDLLGRVVPMIVDTTLHHLLWTMEQEKRVAVLMDPGDGTRRNVAEASDGLAGELQGTRGWIARFSGQRHEG